MNLRHLGPKPSALPTALHPDKYMLFWCTGEDSKFRQNNMRDLPAGATRRYIPIFIWFQSTNYIISKQNLLVKTYGAKKRGSISPFLMKRTYVRRWCRVPGGFHLPRTRALYLCLQSKVPLFPFVRLTARLLPLRYIHYTVFYTLFRLLPV